MSGGMSGGRGIVLEQVAPFYVSRGREVSRFTVGYETESKHCKATRLAARSSNFPV